MNAVQQQAWRKAMKIRTALVLTLWLCPVAWAAEKAEDAATKSAEAWLSLVDQGRYGESWDAAAKVFQGALTRDKWKEALGSARAPLGGLVSRRVQSAEYRTSLPGAPDGKYVVVQFDTTFQNTKRPSKR
jgi:hypothetical protein